MAVKLGIFPNGEKQKAMSVLEKLLAFCKERDIQTVLFDDGKDALNTNISDIDAAISIGGDGTFLHMAQSVAGYGIPVCGINVGRKGFLTEIEILNIRSAVTKIAAGKYTIEERTMLEASVWRGERMLVSGTALNDSVISKDGHNNLVRLSLNINSSKKDSYYSADGIVFATATGSTAYSLSAGGPIVDPTLPVVIITPICPHSLYTRPLIIPDTGEIVIRPCTPYNKMIISNDGKALSEICPGDIVKIKTSTLKSKFIKFGKASYYDTWQQRLQKGETI